MRLLCWLITLLTLGFRGHRWRMVRINPGKHMWLMHLHTMAGLDADCARCGLEWRDAECAVHLPGDCNPVWPDILEVEKEIYVYHWDGPTS